MTLNEWIINVEPSKLEFLKKYDEGIQVLEDFTSLPFIDIKQNIPNLFSEGKYDEGIMLVSGNRDVLKRKEIDRFRMLLWIEKQYVKINEIEKRYLERPPEMKMISAGIKKLDSLGIRNTIDLLANGDVLKWKEIEQLPYSVCFEKQLKLVIENDINKKLVELNRQDRKK